MTCYDIMVAVQWHQIVEEAEHGFLEISRAQTIIASIVPRARDVMITHTDILRKRRGRVADHQHGALWRSVSTRRLLR
jgi:hypothetical protein